MTFTMQQWSGKASLEQMLVAVGFEPSAPRTFRNDSLTLRMNGRWLSVEAPAARSKSQGLSRRGLWKPHGKLAVFEVPASIVAESADIESDETGATGIEQLLDWCEASLSGGEPAGWTAPTDTELRVLAPASAWSIQAGPHVRQIDLILDVHRSTLRVVLIGVVSGALSESRRTWLKGLIDFASNHRRLVHVGVSGGDQRSSIIAEVDLTGCPRQWYAALVPLALAALRHVAIELLSTLSLLCDPHVRCDAWEQSLN